MELTFDEMVTQFLDSLDFEQLTDEQEVDVCRLKKEIGTRKKFRRAISEAQMAILQG